MNAIAGSWTHKPRRTIRMDVLLVGFIDVVFIAYDLVRLFG
jgi:hypothetical protein